MAGFLDPFAASIEAEYTRYINDDILGKILFKNFALNVLDVEKESVEIALSRHGDLGTHKDPADAKIRFEKRSYVVETKISRWQVQKRNKINPIPRWSFSGLKHSKIGTERGKYDLVFAAGIDAPGLEDSLGYWRHFDSLKKSSKIEGRNFGLAKWPHERDFLNQCGFYILPRQFVFTHCSNSPYITIRAIPERLDYEFFAWGYDISRLRKVWGHALEVVNSQSATDSQI